jgi:hypothetical protein
VFLQSSGCFLEKRVHIMSMYAIVGRFLFGFDWLWPYEPPLAPRDALLG